MLSVGIPREIKPQEKRVGLTPRGVRSLCEAGIRVFVENQAGEGSGFSDREYQSAGAEIVQGACDLYRKAELILKVKEPIPPEWEYLRPGLILFCFLHLASPENRRLVEVLLDRKVIGIGLETVEKGGQMIFLAPMSEIAGALAGILAGFFKQFFPPRQGEILYPPRFFEKLEWLARQFPEIPEDLSPGKVVIFGGGTVGRKACETILKMGGEVDLIEKGENRRNVLRREFQTFGPRFRLWGLQDRIEEKLKEAEVWIGCVHRAGERAQLVLSREDFERITRDQPKLILDIAADQGGNFPETRSTTYGDPLYLDSIGNWRFAVTNVPSLCGRGASEAIEKATLPYVLRLAQDFEKAIRQSPELQTGIQVFKGKLVHKAVASAHGLSWEPLP